jgi:hypothetical protein
MPDPRPEHSCPALIASARPRSLVLAVVSKVHPKVGYSSSWRMTACGRVRVPLRPTSSPESWRSEGTP